MPRLYPPVNSANNFLRFMKTPPLLSNKNARPAHNTLPFCYNKKLTALVGLSAHDISSVATTIIPAGRNVFLSHLYGQHAALSSQLRRRLSRLLTFLANSSFYKGSRIRKHLPSRGQRTHTNASTSRKLNYVK
jgi:ribosomal protein S13